MKGRGRCRLVSWGLVAGLLALPLLADADEPSLGEAARKERERREKRRESGAVARTLTEEDLATTKGRIANAPNPAGAAAPAPANKAAAAAAPEDKAAKPTRNPTLGSPARDDEASTSRATEAYWRARSAAARLQVAVARARYDDLQRSILIGQPEAYGANGQVVIRSIYRMKELADRAAAALASAQAALDDVLEEGRKAGALPGWLR